MAHKVEIKVFLMPGEDPDWAFSSELPQRDGNFIFVEDESDHEFHIYFKLQPGNSGYKFPSKKELALAATPVAGVCPDQGTTWKERFTPIKVKDDNLTLKVHNKNAKDEECEFSYSLFVTKEPENEKGEFWKLDPGGINQGRRQQGERPR